MVNGLRLTCALNWHAQRDDRTCPYEKRDGVDGRGHGDGLAPFCPLVSPVVVPVGAGRQVDLAAGRALFRNRSHKEGRAKHVLIAQVGYVGIEREIERKRAHEWCTSEPGLVRERVNVGHELVAQAQVLFQNWLGLAAVGPDLVGGAAAVSPEDWQECGVLEPPC